MGAELSTEVREFIMRHIVSLEELEVLLLLHEHPEREWSAAEINDRIRSQEGSIQKWLTVLVSLKLAAEANGRFRYAPSSTELAANTDALASIYRARRLKVIELIFSKPNEKLLSFAQAFDLKKRP